MAEALDRLRREVRSNLAAMQAWEGGLYQTIDLTPLLADVRCPTWSSQASWI